MFEYKKGEHIPQTAPWFIDETEDSKAVFGCDCIIEMYDETKFKYQIRPTNKTTKNEILTKAKDGDIPNWIKGLRIKKS